MREAKRLLELLTRAIPPPKGREHSLTMRSLPGPPGLSVSLQGPQGVRIIHFDEEDLDLELEQLAENILELYRRPRVLARCHASTIDG